MKRLAFIISIVALASLGLAAPVLAAAPGNDTYTSRTVIGAIPFAESIDTTEATTDADDTEANAQCGAPATDASVWYEVTASSDGGILVDASASSYAAGVIVATGTPGSLSVLTCGPWIVGLPTVAGETYAILVFDFDAEDGVNGGELDIVVDETPPPPVVDVSIDAVGSFNAQTGSATIRGTVTCSGGDEFSKNFIDVQVSQKIGRFKLTGQGGTEFVCDGAVQAWSVEVISSTGTFAGGKASVTLFAFACGPGGCSDTSVERTISLKR
jgi:hypothetical protein